MSALDEKIHSLVAPLETERSQVYKRYRISLIIGIPGLIVGFILLILMMLFSWPDFTMIFVAICLIAGFVGIALAAYSSSNFKKKAISTLAATVDETLFPAAVKNPNVGLNLKTLLTPGFFATPDRYIQSNLRKAVYETIPFEQGDYNLQRREEHTDSKGNTYVSYETYAAGTMYHFTFERNFGQIVKVLERAGLLTLGSGGLIKKETEYIAFNKKFVVLTSDETTVFYLLTPQIQEKILSLESKFKGQFYLAFIGNELFIAINDSHSSIALPLKTPITYENLAPIVECLAIPAVFINLLGLAKAKFEKNAGVAS